MNRTKSQKIICSKNVKKLMNLHTLQDIKQKSPKKSLLKNKFQYNKAPSPKKLSNRQTTINQKRKLHKSKSRELIKCNTVATIPKYNIEVQDPIQKQNVKVLNLEISDFENRHLLKQKIKKYIIENHIVKNEQFDELRSSLIKRYIGSSVMLCFCIDEIIKFLES